VYEFVQNSAKRSRSGRSSTLRSQNEDGILQYNTSLKDIQAIVDVDNKENVPIRPMTTDNMEL